MNRLAPSGPTPFGEKTSNSSYLQTLGAYVKIINADCWSSSQWHLTVPVCSGLLTFLLTASHALLQQRLAVEGGEGRGCVLLHPWVGLGQSVHRAGSWPIGHGGPQATIHGPHTCDVKRKLMSYLHKNMTPFRNVFCCGDKTPRIIFYFCNITNLLHQSTWKTVTKRWQSSQHRLIKH